MSSHILPTSTTEVFIAPPAFSRDIVRYLQQVFPNRLPLNIHLSDRELGACFGVQKVIDHLDALLQHQEEENQLPHVFQTKSS